MISVNLEREKLTKYLQIAANQRKRAAAKFVQDYGPSSATVKEVSQEIANLDLEINRITAEQDKTPIEQAADRPRK